jgi:hypothetical protein
MEGVSEKSKAYSEILRDIGQVMFAAMVIGPIVSRSVDIPSAVYGLFFSSIAWYLSVSFVKE